MGGATPGNRESKVICGRAVFSFVVTLILCSAFIALSARDRINAERLQMEQLIVEKSAKANEILSRLIEKTQVLSALVLQANGEVEDFELIAANIIDDPSILNVLLAPGGKVTDVYPLEGNEAVIGWDYFEEGVGNKEALMALETGRLVFGGPFDSVQGGQILVGRLPVYIYADDGSQQFWGLVSVTLKYPQVLDGAGFSELAVQGYEYEVWRINPDDGERQIITASGSGGEQTGRFIEKQVSIQNAEWIFRILPVRAWYQYPDTWLMALLGLCICFLVGILAQRNNELTILKNSYRKQSHTDHLTGIYNRRYFLDNAIIQAERVDRTKTQGFIILFDIDLFKKINDRFGHVVGDEVLRGIALRVGGILRPYDLFARYGGEEFIILVTDTCEENALILAERIRATVAQTPIVCEGNKIEVTASFGVAEVTCAGDFLESIDRADKALYEAKNSGRNTVSAYRPGDRLSV